MSSSKIPPQHGAGGYRDDDTASSSSAVLLGDIDTYPDDELPAYADVDPSRKGPVVNPRPNGGLIWYDPPTVLPFSSTNMDQTETRTQFPDYSNHPETLLSMLHDQASFPPTYIVRMTGTHTETSKRGNKEEKTTVTDFTIMINQTSLLQPRPREGGYIEILPDNARGYRGSILPTMKPTSTDNDVEQHPDELRVWCERYVQNPAHLKSFLLKREVTNHDRTKLEQLLRSAIAETGYRGHVRIDWPTMHKRVIVYSPGLINGWRTTTWVRWLFYLTFLWVLTWPILFFTTRKYEVVKVVFPYADRPEDDGRSRRCTVMSEMDWFRMWEGAVKRAALARMQCRERCLDEEYRLATLEAERRGAMVGRGEMPNTGNAFADSAISVIGQVGRVAEGWGWNAMGGWGGDC